jgi:hypothetical protein
METVKVRKLCIDRHTIKSKIFPTYLALFHVSFIILMAIFGKYRGEEEVPNLYPSSQSTSFLYFYISKQIRPHILKL